MAALSRWARSSSEAVMGGRERADGRVDDLVVDVAGELVGEVGRFGRGRVIHGGSMSLVIAACPMSFSLTKVCAAQIPGVPFD